MTQPNITITCCPHPSVAFQQFEIPFGDQTLQNFALACSNCGTIWAATDRKLPSGATVEKTEESGPYQVSHDLLVVGKKIPRMPGTIPGVCFVCRSPLATSMIVIDLSGSIEYCCEDHELTHEEIMRYADAHYGDYPDPDLTGDRRTGSEFLTPEILILDEYRHEEIDRLNKDLLTGTAKIIGSRATPFNPEEKEN